MEEKIQAESLLYKKKNIWQVADETEKNEIKVLNELYKKFLDESKTEREAAKTIEKIAKENGFQELKDVDQIQPGSKVIFNYRNKSVFMAVIGKEPLENGCRFVGSHSDAPRLDLKPHPLYEKENLALMKTHYYGGIKKYHWVGIPLSLHGVVCLKNGKTIDITIGEKESDPVFTITDLLPHLSKDQMNKKLADAIEGENLNILVGSNPIAGEKTTNPVKLAILDLLNQQYNMEEEDFVSAELEVVPAWKAKDVGLDKGLVGAYGQDDRICVFTSLKAILETEAPQYTAVTMFMDKEEIGSSGNTGMAGRTFENIMAEIIDKTEPNYSEILLRRCLSNSWALSADVDAAIDPNYPEVMDHYNCSKMGFGIALTKYTGSRGKYSANDAHAEFLGTIRQLLNKNNIIWQTGEMGKVDQGGGGTIAYLMSAYGMDVLDCGVALLGMHSPFEIASKSDVYSAYQAYKAFLND